MDWKFWKEQVLKGNVSPLVYRMARQKEYYEKKLKKIRELAK